MVGGGPASALARKAISINYLAHRRPAAPDASSLPSLQWQVSTPLLPGIQTMLSLPLQQRDQGRRGINANPGLPTPTPAPASQSPSPQPAPCRPQSALGKDTSHQLFHRGC